MSEIVSTMSAADRRAANGRVLRLGIIGLGGATKQMLPSFKNDPRVLVVAGADPRAEARARFAADFGARAYEKAETLCLSGEIDAIYIATPNTLHMAHAVTAADLGKHVVVEKPMATTIAECDAIIDAARRNKIHLIVGHTHSFNAPIIKMREIICSGDIGSLAMIHTWNCNDYLYRPRWPDELRTELGGGSVHNQVSHQVDMVRYLGGGLVKSVRSVVWNHDPLRASEGSHMTFLQFSNDSAACLVFSSYDRFDSDEFHFWVGEGGEEKSSQRHGSTYAAHLRLAEKDAEATLKRAQSYGGSAPGSDALDSGGRPWHHMHFGVTIASCANGDLRAAADSVELYGKHGRVDIALPKARVFPDKSGVIDELYDAVVCGRPPQHDGQWGKATVEVCEAILTSARERREVEVKHQVALR